MILGSFGKVNPTDYRNTERASLSTEDDDILEILDEILNDRRDTPYERPTVDPTDHRNSEGSSFPTTLTLDLPDDDVLDVPDVEPEPEVDSTNHRKPKGTRSPTEAKRVIIIDPNDLGLENQPKRVIIIDL